MPGPFVSGRYAHTAGAVPQVYGSLPAILSARDESPAGNFTPRLKAATALQNVIELGTTGNTTGNTATVTSGSFTPAPNTLLVAYCMGGNGSAQASNNTGTVTDSLGGTWTRKGLDVSTFAGEAAIWVRDIGPTPAAMTVTFDPGGAMASGLMIRCTWYGNARPAAQQPGTVALNALAGTYSVSITPTATGSLLAGAFSRATDSQTLTANANTTAQGSFSGSAGDVVSAFRGTALSVAGQAVTLGFSNATGAGNNAIAVVEILPVPPPAAAQDATPTPSTIAGAVAFPAATQSADSTAVPVTITSVVSMGAPAAQAGAAPAPATITGSTGMAAVTVAAGAAAAPATITGSTTVSGAAQASVTAAPGTIARSVVISGTPALAVAITPATISRAVVITGTASGSALSAPATISGGTTISGTASGSALPTPGTIAPVTVVIGGTAVTASGTTALPGTIAGSTTVSGAAQSSRTAAPSVILGAVTLSGTPALAVRIAPGTITGTAAIGPHSAAAGSGVLPATVQGSTAIAAVTLSAGAVPAPSAILGTVTVGPHISGAATLVPVSTITGTAAVTGSPATGAVALAGTISRQVVISGAVLAGGTAAPGTIARTVEMGAVQVSTITQAFAPVIAGAVSISGTAGAGVAPARPAILGAVVITGAASASRTVTVATISRSIVMGAPTVRLSAAILPLTVAGSTSIPEHAIRVSARMLVPTILALIEMAQARPTSGYVEPAPGSSVTGDRLRPGVAGDALLAGVTGSALSGQVVSTGHPGGIYDSSSDRPKAEVI